MYGSKNFYYIFRNTWTSKNERKREYLIRVVIIGREERGRKGCFHWDLFCQRRVKRKAKISSSHQYSIFLVHCVLGLDSFTCCGCGNGTKIAWLYIRWRLRSSAPVLYGVSAMYLLKPSLIIQQRNTIIFIL